MSLNENLIFNKEDLEFNVDKFESGESNILLVTGFSGSGKTTLATDVATKYNCTLIELDYFTDYLFGNVTKEDLLHDDEEGLAEYVELNNLSSNHKYEDFTNQEIEDLIRDYIKFIINWCKNQGGRRFVIEGLQIYDVYKEGDYHITNCPIIIKGTSGLISTLRAAKRNGGSTLKNFGQLIKYIFKDDKSLNALEKDIAKQKSFADEFKEYETMWN